MWVKYNVLSAGEPVHAAFDLLMKISGWLPPTPKVARYDWELFYSKFDGKFFNLFQRVTYHLNVSTL